MLSHDAGLLKLGEFNKATPRTELKLRVTPDAEVVNLARSAAGLPLLAMDTTGSVVVAATNEPAEKGRVLAWDTRSNRLLLESPVHASALAISPSGAMIAAVQGGRVAVWSSRNGNKIADLPLPHGIPQALAFAPDDRRLAVGDSAGTVTIWDVGLVQPVV
jgi:WD40 repeat protein